METLTYKALKCVLKALILPFHLNEKGATHIQRIEVCVCVLKAQILLFHLNEQLCFKILNEYGEQLYNPTGERINKMREGIGASIFSLKVRWTI